MAMKPKTTSKPATCCVSPSNYNQQIVEDIAFTNARDKIWPLAGYALKQKLYEESL